jgi:hypothetical protein
VLSPIVASSWEHLFLYNILCSVMKTGHIYQWMDITREGTSQLHVMATFQGRADPPPPPLRLERANPLGLASQIFFDVYLNIKEHSVSITSKRHMAIDIFSGMHSCNVIA